MSEGPAKGNAAGGGAAAAVAATAAVLARQGTRKRVAPQRLRDEDPPVVQTRVAGVLRAPHTEPPEGWRREVLARITVPGSDVYYFCPSGRAHRSGPDVARFLAQEQNQHLPYTLEAFDFVTRFEGVQVHVADFSAHLPDASVIVIDTDDDDDNDAEEEEEEVDEDVRPRKRWGGETPPRDPVPNGVAEGIRGGGVGGSGVAGATDPCDVQWTAGEQRVLEEGLEKYAAEQVTSLWRYIKIAADLPAKGPRDVALRIRWISQREGEKTNTNTTPNRRKACESNGAVGEAAAAEAVTGAAGWEGGGAESPPEAEPEPTPAALAPAPPRPDPVPATGDYEGGSRAGRMVEQSMSGPGYEGLSEEEIRSKRKEIKRKRKMIRSQKVAAKVAKAHAAATDAVAAATAEVNRRRAAAETTLGEERVRAAAHAAAALDVIEKSAETYFLAMEVAKAAVEDMEAAEAAAAAAAADIRAAVSRAEAAEARAEAAEVEVQVRADVRVQAAEARAEAKAMVAEKAADARAEAAEAKADARLEARVAASDARATNAETRIAAMYLAVGSAMNVAAAPTATTHEGPEEPYQ